MINFKKIKKQLSFRQVKWPETYFGFPIESPESIELEKRSQKKGRPTVRGLSLLIAIIAITMMIMFVSDLMITSGVAMNLATSQRDRIKAEYMAKSALNVGIFLVSIDWALDISLASGQLGIKQPKSDGVGDIWGMLNGLPIGGETLEMVSQFQENFNLTKVMGGDVLKQLQLFDGEFILNVEDESKKINVNYCALGRCTEVLLMLEALFSCPAEKLFLEKKNINPKELAYKIKDWVDSNDSASPESGYNDESTPYLDAKPPYKTKNAPMDTLEELRLIEGWDHEMHQVFSPFLTVYPFQSKKEDKPRININTAHKALLSCLIPESTKDCGEKFALALEKRAVDRTNLIEEGESTQDTIRKLMCYTNTEGVSSAQANDPQDKSQWFVNETSVFRMRIVGQVREQSRTLEAVIQRSMPDPKKKDSASYKILYWHLL